MPLRDVTLGGVCLCVFAPQKTHMQLVIINRNKKLCMCRVGWGLDAACIWTACVHRACGALVDNFRTAAEGGGEGGSPLLSPEHIPSNIMATCTRNSQAKADSARDDDLGTCQSRGPVKGGRASRGHGTGHCKRPPLLGDASSVCFDCAFLCCLPTTATIRSTHAAGHLQITLLERCSSLTTALSTHAGSFAATSATHPPGQ